MNKTYVHLLFAYSFALHAAASSTEQQSSPIFDKPWPMITSLIEEAVPKEISAWRDLNPYRRSNPVVTSIFAAVSPYVEEIKRESGLQEDDEVGIVSNMVAHTYFLLHSQKKISVGNETLDNILLDALVHKCPDAGYSFKVMPERFARTICCGQAWRPGLLRAIRCYLSSLEGIDEFIEEKERRQETKILVKTLDLRENCLRSMPRARFDLLCTFPQLCVLYISNNFLESIPNEIFSLINLKELSLSCNKITELPKDVKCLTQLTTLDLAFNKLQALPLEDLLGSEKLQFIHVEYNQFTEEYKQIIKGAHVRKETYVDGSNLFAWCMRKKKYIYL